MHGMLNIVALPACAVNSLIFVLEIQVPARYFTVSIEVGVDLESAIPNCIEKTEVGELELAMRNGIFAFIGISVH